MIVTQFRTHLICVLTGLSWIGRQVPYIERYVDGTVLLNHKLWFNQTVPSRGQNDFK